MSYRVEIFDDVHKGLGYRLVCVEGSIEVQDEESFLKDMNLNWNKRPEKTRKVCIDLGDIYFRSGAMSAIVTMGRKHRETYWENLSLIVRGRAEQVFRTSKLDGILDIYRDLNSFLKKFD